MAPVTDPIATTPGGDPPDPIELLRVARAAAEGAGALLLEGLGRARSRVTTKTTATDMVTEMDEAAERYIAEHVRAARPDDAITGEEGTSDRGRSTVEWIVDPIDGTTNYLYGHPGFAVSVAAAVRDEVVAGVVVDPVHGEVFTATLGGGARRNDLPIAASSQEDLSLALVATGFSYDPARRRRQAEVLVEVMPSVRDLRRMGAAAMDLCSVACGRVDAYYERGLARWDYAAGALVAGEAGALAGDLDGGPPSGDFLVVAAPGIFTELVALLHSAGARRI